MQEYDRRRMHHVSTIPQQNIKRMYFEIHYQRVIQHNLKPVYLIDEN